MFKRLINSFGKLANQQDDLQKFDPELRLATAMLLFSVLPVDYVVSNLEATALHNALTKIFKLSPKKSHRMIARAAAAHNHDSNIVAASTLLKHRTSLAFRSSLLAEVNVIMRADGALTANELDLKRRIERLLGLTTEYILKTA